ncbi:MAG: LysM peptidoglycan-binding domain-containing protein [Phycisphaerales bacterium]|nr:LysM peptidoglycan-binding domain-containing protein [Phycisphaerae bacterium]NNF44920.1 LysM peptidoglycan-binding domain-containing protein [Phycisphaerales bacterium]NNM26258.1 LysM peptidoglycan-binding domain-containing protein [Phycisphaerales bacterium]
MCERYFGDATLVPELARYNGLEDPDALAATQRLRIPDAADLVRQPLVVADTDAAASPPPASPTPRAIEYTVKEGDNLSKLAKRFLGSPHAFATIYERNRDVIKKPDMLRAGMVLTIPLPDDVG